MMKVIEGKLDSKGQKIAIIISRFNDFISSKLLEGAKDALIRTGANEEDITIVKVPGAFEIPQAAAKLVTHGNYDGVICLGVIIRGATPHFDYIASEAAKGVAQTAIKVGLPLTFGILTTDNLEQAIERAGSKSGNKGFEAAISMVEMINLYKQL